MYAEDVSRVEVEQYLPGTTTAVPAVRTLQVTLQVYEDVPRDRTALSLLEHPYFLHGQQVKLHLQAYKAVDVVGSCAQSAIHNAIRQAEEQRAVQCGEKPRQIQSLRLFWGVDPKLRASGRSHSSFTMRDSKPELFMEANPRDVFIDSSHVRLAYPGASVHEVKWSVRRHEVCPGLQCFDYGHQLPDDLLLCIVDYLDAYSQHRLFGSSLHAFRLFRSRHVALASIHACVAYVLFKGQERHTLRCPDNSGACNDIWGLMQQHGVDAVSQQLFQMQLEENADGEDGPQPEDAHSS